MPCAKIQVALARCFPKQLAGGAKLGKPAIRNRSRPRKPNQRTWARKCSACCASIRVFLRLSDAVKGSERAAGEAPGTTQSWLALRNKIATTNVAGATEGPASSTTSENDQVNNDLHALADEARRSLAHLELGARSGAVPADVATAERARLQNILERINVAEAKASQASGNSSDAATGSELPNMVARDSRARAPTRSGSPFP